MSDIQIIAAQVIGVIICIITSLISFIMISSAVRELSRRVNSEKVNALMAKEEDSLMGNILLLVRGVVLFSLGGFIIYLAFL